MANKVVKTGEKLARARDETISPVKVHMSNWLRDELSIQAIREGKDRSKLIVEVLTAYLNKVEQDWE